MAKKFAIRFSWGAIAVSHAWFLLGALAGGEVSLRLLGLAVAIVLAALEACGKNAFGPISEIREPRQALAAGLILTLLHAGAVERRMSGADPNEGLPSAAVAVVLASAAILTGLSLLANEPRVFERSPLGAGVSPNVFSAEASLSALLGGAARERAWTRRTQALAPPR